MLRDKVIDGTPCGPDTFHICVNGQCKPAGCDHVLNSTAELDTCGVCRGDNSTCQRITGSYNASVYGYTRVAKIPAGSSYIDIRQRGWLESHNDSNYLGKIFSSQFNRPIYDEQFNATFWKLLIRYFIKTTNAYLFGLLRKSRLDHNWKRIAYYRTALRIGENGEYILNGNFMVMHRKVIVYPGVTIEYSGPESIIERLNSSRPIAIDLILEASLLIIFDYNYVA